MSGELAVELKRLGKRYTKYEDTPMLLSRAAHIGRANRRSHLWALRNVDLAVRRGESVGVIGRNGAGKTTMLRILAGITAPTEGTVTVNGLVAPLIAVGVGFHQELTGRENVFVNGMILGMSTAEVERRFDSIVDFAELHEFIDTPVKFYSSGMFVRLGFAVAVAAQPEVLLVDEILAVGDIAFQMKCYERIGEMKQEGTTLLLVSHNLNAVRIMCDRVLVIKQGEPVFLGEPDDAITAFYEEAGADPDLDVTEQDATAPVKITRFEMLDPSGRATGVLNSGEEAVFRIHTAIHQPLDDPTFAFVLQTASGIPVYTDSTFERGSGRFAAGDEPVCDIRFRAPLTTGGYTARANVRWSENPDDRVTSAAIKFHVNGPHLVAGVIDLAARWEIA